MLSDINAGYNPLLPQHYSLFPGMLTPHYPDDFDYEHFYDNFFSWHKPNPNDDHNYKYPSSDHSNNHKSTTEATTTTEQITGSNVSAKVPEQFLQSPEEITIEENNELHKEEIVVSSKEKEKIVDKKPITKDEDLKDSDKPEVIISDLKLKTNESHMKQISANGDKLFRSTENDIPINIGQMDTISLPVSNMMVPALSIQSMSQGSPVLNPEASNNPAGNFNGYAASSEVVQNNEPANINDYFRPSVPQVVPLNIPQNPVNNHVQPNYIATVPNNAIINNIPNTYYIVSNSQATLLNNGVQTQTPLQMYTLVPISNLGSNVITNQAGNLVNQQNQNYELPNQASNMVAYNNQWDNSHVNQPNNYVPLISQPNYVTLSNQPTNFIPLNNQGNQYVPSQSNNLVRFIQPKNMVAVNNNQPSNMLAVGNQPYNFVVLNSQPNNMVAINNQPDNLVALNSGGNIPSIVQAQPQQNVGLYSLKDENKEDDSIKKEEEKERKINVYDKIHPSEETDEAVIA